MSRSAAVFLAAGALTLALATPVGAHALLSSTIPGDGEELEQAPEAVVLEFSEPVSTSAGAVRVYDSDGAAVASGDASTEEGDVLRLALPDGLEDDTYIVTWRVVSADGHPVRGAFLFSVGEAAGADDSLVARLFSGTADRPYAIGAAVGRWVEYSATLLAAGAVAFVLWVHERRTGGLDEFRGVVVKAAALGIVASVVGVALQAALVSGLGLGALTTSAVLADTAASGFGASALVRFAGLVAVLVWVRAPSHPVVFGLGGAVAALGSMLLAGHTVTTEPRWLVLLADAAHVGAAAAWFGGLVLLWLALRRHRLADDPVGGARLVARFSTMATTALVAVAVAGLALAWVEVRAVRALVTTSYGWTLVVKVALFAAVLALGAYNRQRLVPAVAGAATYGAGDRDVAVPAGGAAASMHTPGRAWALLRRIVRLEVLGLLAVLAATAVLVYLQPAAQAAGITGAYSTYEALGDYQINVTVDPNRAGFNEIHLYLLDETGRPVDVAQDVLLRLSQPQRDIGPIERVPRVAGPGHWSLAGPELSLPGRWVIEVVVRLSEFDQLSAEVPVVVGR